MDIVQQFACIACGGTELCFGELGKPSNIFIPSGVFTIYGFRTRSYVCLSCGHVNTYVPREKVERLKRKFKEDEDI